MVIKKRVYSLIGAAAFVGTFLESSRAFEIGMPSSSPRTAATGSSSSFNRGPSSALFVGSSTTAPSQQRQHRGFSSSIQDSESKGANVHKNGKFGVDPFLLSAVAISGVAPPGSGVLSRRVGLRVPSPPLIIDDADDVQLPSESDLNPLLQQSSSSTTASSWLETYLLPVLGAAFLITGNTIGASCLVLPEVASGPGMLASSGIFFLAYIFNWLSGVTLAEVAIRQKEQQQEHGDAATAGDVPSSFKELAGVNLGGSEVAATIVSSISVFVNTCVLSFDLTRAGDIGSSLLGSNLPVPALAVSAIWATALGAMVATQSAMNLSKVSSVLVSLLFITFGGILLPGLASVHDPINTWLQPGTAPNLLEGISHAAPVLLMTLVYQNVVPSVTKMLNYDRSKTVAALSLGSFLPLLLFISFCYASLGGGIDGGSLIHGSAAGGFSLLTAFSVTTLAGSSLGSVLSLSEEFDTYIGGGSGSKKKQVDSAQEDGSGFGLPAVAGAVAVPLITAMMLSGGDDLTAALQLAGGFGTPILYGVLPALMAWNQRKNTKAQVQKPQPLQLLEDAGEDVVAAFSRRTTAAAASSVARQPEQPLVPTATLGVLGFLSTGYVGEELISKVGNAAADAIVFAS